MDIPPGVEKIFLENGLSLSDVLDMSELEWREFENHIGNAISYGFKLKMRRHLHSKLQEEALSVDIAPELEEAKLKHVLASVQKLFDEDTCVGTFVFVKETIGICAFHSVQTKGVIRQDTLTVQGCSVEHVVSFPYYDLSIYKVLGRKGACVELEQNSAIYVGNFVFLCSFPALDSQTADDPDEEAWTTSGRIARKEIDSEMSVAQYMCFPNSSGGAVISTRGKLLGIHLQGLYHECHPFYRPQGTDTKVLTPDEAVYSLQWENGDTTSSNEEQPLQDFETETPTKLARFAASNVQHKGHLGVFLPISVISRKLADAGILTPTRKMKYPPNQRMKRCKSKV